MLWSKVSSALEGLSMNESNISVIVSRKFTLNVCGTMQA